MRRLSPLLLLLTALALSACGGGAGDSRVGDYVGGAVRLECAPFARALSGVQLHGPAADWWWKADGRYARAYTPRTGAVMVMRRSPRLPYGHVAVVSKVLSSREILVTQANWVRDRVTEDQPVVDVSTRNDWSMVRVWWPPSRQMGGTDYPAHGFVHASRPKSREELTAATPVAVRVALAGP